MGGSMERNDSRVYWIFVKNWRGTGWRHIWRCVTCVSGACSSCTISNTTHRVICTPTTTLLPYKHHPNPLHAPLQLQFSHASKVPSPQTCILHAFMEVGSKFTRWWASGDGHGWCGGIEKWDKCLGFGWRLGEEGIDVRLSLKFWLSLHIRTLRNYNSLPCRSNVFRKHN